MTYHEGGWRFQGTTLGLPMHWELTANCSNTYPVRLQSHAGGANLEIVPKMEPDTRDGAEADVRKNGLKKPLGPAHLTA